MVQGAVGASVDSVSLEGLRAPREGTDESRATEEPGADDLEHMADRARLHRRLRDLESHHQPTLISRSDAACPVRVATRSRAFGVGLGTGGDWFDVIPRPGGGAALILGDAAGRGIEGAAVMSELRSAARAYALLEDHSPALLVQRLDALVRSGGAGRGSAVRCLDVSGSAGRVRMSAAGSCPTLVAKARHRADFVGTPGPTLGNVANTDHPLGDDDELILGAGDTLFLFTAGLAGGGNRSLDDGYEWLRVAASRAPEPLDDACGFVFDACLARRVDDDAMLVALRLDGAAVPALSPVAPGATGSTVNGT